MHATNLILAYMATQRVTNEAGHGNMEVERRVALPETLLEITICFGRDEGPDRRVDKLGTI